MAKKIILRFKDSVTPEKMYDFAKRVKDDLERENVIFVNSDIEVFVVEEGDEIRIENEDINRFGAIDIRSRFNDEEV